MSWDGGGTFNRVHNFSADASAGIQAQASRFDAEFDAYKTGLETCLTITGETTPSANQPMGGFRHTGVAAGASADNYATVSQLIGNTPIWIRNISVNAVTSFSASAPLYSVNPSDGMSWILQFESASVAGLSPAITASTSVLPTLMKMYGVSTKVVDTNGENVLRGQLQGREPKVVIYNASTSAYVLMNPHEGSCAAHLSVSCYLGGVIAHEVNILNNANMRVTRKAGGIEIQPAFDFGNTQLTVPVSGLTLSTSCDEMRVELPQPFAGTWRPMSGAMVAINDGQTGGVMLRKTAYLDIASANSTYASIRPANGGAISTTGTATVGIPGVAFFCPRAV